MMRAKKKPAKKAPSRKTAPLKKAPPAKASPKKAARPRPLPKAPRPAMAAKAPVLKEPGRGISGKSLVIVESPAKAKTINRYLGRGYDVRASMGHVRDLPVKELGVDVEKDFTPHYVTIRGKGNLLRELQAAARRARAVYLALDWDREGEAIAWHLAESFGDGRAPLHRVSMNEITERAIREAFRAPGEIDLRKVNAQQARRILDRLVGYQVSPVLWKTVHRRTSAGRVQSVALRLVVEREDEIRRFVSREYWTIDVDLATPAGARLRARLHKQGGHKIQLENEETALRTEEELRRQPDFRVSEIVRKDRRRSPRPPFITSTLQQEASVRLGMSPRRTMQIAQELYEGLEVDGGEVVGLITYMRTDSVRLASEAVAEARDYIAATYGPEYLPARPPVYRVERGGPVQDAHEAIRPTSVARRPEDLPGLSTDQRRLYELVWRRMVACQMPPAVDAMTTVTLEAGAFQLHAVGRVPVFAGYRAVYADPEAMEAEGAPLPALAVGDRLSVTGLERKQHFTEPPPRFSEASLIRELEANGVGRPSTYATIVNTITERQYATRERGRLIPSQLGETVLRILLDGFPDIFTVDFTARMEEELDEVEAGATDWRTVVREFYEPFTKDLARAKAQTAEIKRALTATTDRPCPRCGKLLQEKWGRNGRFLACSGFPACRHSEPLPEESTPDVSGAVCEKCGGPMVVRTGRFGRFLACQRYPECRHTRPLPLGLVCPLEGCTGELTERRTRRGKIFYGCSRYPECKFATWDRPIAGPCPACGSPVLLEKTRRTQVLTTCPRCGHRSETALVAQAAE